MLGLSLAGCGTSYEECRTDNYKRLQQCVRDVLRSDARRPGDLGDCYREHDRVEARCEKLKPEGTPARPPKL